MRGYESRSGPRQNTRGTDRTGHYPNRDYPDIPCPTLRRVQERCPRPYRQGNTYSLDGSLRVDPAPSRFWTWVLSVVRLETVVVPVTGEGRTSGESPGPGPECASRDSGVSSGYGTQHKNREKVQPCHSESPPVTERVPVCTNYSPSVGPRSETTGPRRDDDRTRVTGVRRV